MILKPAPPSLRSLLRREALMEMQRLLIVFLKKRAFDAKKKMDLHIDYQEFNSFSEDPKYEFKIFAHSGRTAL